MAHFFKSHSWLLICVFFFSLNSCTAQEAEPFFYQGLIVRAEGVGSAASTAIEAAEQAKARTAAAALFEKALNNPNAHIRSAAAAELLSLYSEGGELSAAALNIARREAVGSWAGAFDVLFAEPALMKAKALSYILGAATTAGDVFPDEAARYALRELRNRDADFFSSAENAAIDGHIAASRSRFSEALLLFRTVLNGEAAENSRIFLQYPALINDLGRSFQYATNSREGIDLFLEWEKNSVEGQNPDVRFRLFFFAARIARQRGLFDQGIELFDRALPFAPDSVQADACIWYILDSALSRSPAAAVRQLELYAPRWHDPAYFSDVLDKLSREFAARRQWKELVTVFDLIRTTGDADSVAKYAWIIYRALEEGYLPAATASAAAAPADLSAAAFLAIAYNAGSKPSYYRAQSAAVLEKPFLEPAAPSTGEEKKSAAMEFLLGFFSNNAAQFAPQYIRPFENELSAGDLRTLAEALQKAGHYTQSLRLVSVYMNQEDYEPELRDYELHYPRPFRELVEQYAAETGIRAALLYGLIRTESAFQSDVVSSAGAIGLTQLLPATAQDMAGRIRRRGGPDYTQGPD
ncbi:MAG: transglycosylase SLT domain-containing protein, partial [Treponema sp.]|nr:transglycosylase SLT domain-containing protein [Treponema sp.]